MNLVACAVPPGTREPAPQTALRCDTDAERWDGFWVDDGYYVRCTLADGQVQWYRPEEPAADAVEADAKEAAPEIPVPATSSRTRAIMVRVGGRRSPLALVGIRRRARPAAHHAAEMQPVS
jgi:hypothetical protein